MGRVLVVDGMITNDTTVVDLSWSIPVNDELLQRDTSVFVADAVVRIETNDGTRFEKAEYKGRGKYAIPNGVLEKGKQYRLYVSADGLEYASEFLSPLFTPAIDSLSWRLNQKGDNIYVCVSTHDPENQSYYYRWSYKEIWEFHVELFANGRMENGNRIWHSLTDNTYYCWGRDSSITYILDSSEKLYKNVIAQKVLTKFPLSDERISTLYYIEVKQYQIRKPAYDYYSNVRRNVEQTGSIFSTIPGEIKGNITCLSDPGRITVGYVEVATMVEQKRFFEDLTGVYLPPVQDCAKNFMYIMYELPPGYEYYFLPPELSSSPPIWAPRRCVDCRERGTKNKPSFWPTENL
jgi:hypothetical protein